MDTLPIELKRMQIKVIVLTHAERLWQGLTGNSLVLAKEDLKWLANGSGARVVLVGDIDVVEPVFEYPPLAWRFTWVRRKDVLDATAMKEG